MYHSDLKVTLGIVIGVLVSSTFFLVVNEDEGDMIYKSCFNDGFYIYPNKNTITCKVK